MTDFKMPEGYTFNIIHHRGSPNEATTVDGAKIVRKPSLYFETYGFSVPCAPYEAHFTYIDPNPDHKVGRWSPMCTCGSPAGIVGLDAYKLDASPQGALVVCLMHAQMGKHSDGTTG
jgi:hypothetical protein